jgi:excisionase family DNA binding protein
MANKILTVSELADHLNVHRITIYRLLKNGTLPGFKIGRVWRFDLDEITSWMATGKSAGEMLAVDGIEQTDGLVIQDGYPARDGHPDGAGVDAARGKSTDHPPARSPNKPSRGAKAARR